MLLSLGGVAAVDDFDDEFDNEFDDECDDDMMVMDDEVGVG